MTSSNGWRVNHPPRAGRSTRSRRDPSTDLAQPRPRMLVIGALSPTLS